MEEIVEGGNTAKKAPKRRDRYSKPGPGVAADAPRRKGLARLWEVISRDCGSFFMAASLCILALAPYGICLVAATLLDSLPVLVVGAGLGGALEGPFFCGMIDTALRSLRDEPGYWWHTWKKAMRQNWRGSLLPGALFGALFGLQIFQFFHLDPAAWQPWQAALLLTSCLFGAAVSVWYWPQTALLLLPLPLLAKNSFLLTLAHPLRSLAAAGIWIGYASFVVLFFPLSLLLLMLTLWLPAVCALLIIYLPLEITFHVEEGTRRLHEQERASN